MTGEASTLDLTRGGCWMTSSGAACLSKDRGAWNHPPHHTTPLPACYPATLLHGYYPATQRPSSPLMVEVSGVYYKKLKCIAMTWVRYRMSGNATVE